MSRAMPNQLNIITIRGIVPKPKIIWARINTAGTPNPSMPKSNFLLRSVKNWSDCILVCEEVVV